MHWVLYVVLGAGAVLCLLALLSALSSFIH